MVCVLGAPADVARGGLSDRAACGMARGNAPLWERPEMLGVRSRWW
jgi:hypothetical protein